MVKLKADFFFVWSVLFLLIVIIGFIPSFILRPLFTDRGIPFYLTFHGIVMIVWFVGVFFQSLLIAQERTLDHMKYGRYWFVLAMFLLLTNTQVMISISNEVMQG